MSIRGKVIKGAGDGKKLGFPTANVDLSSPLDLAFGVYATLFTVDGATHQSVLHYGPRLVFGEEKPQFEVYIFNFDQDIYGKIVEIEIKDFIRPTQKFSSLEAMIEQIHKDCEEAKKMLQ